ncbi:MAG: hypothetical protein LBH40_05325 [Alphaproteobacteria bacterium]|jgi:hypothetical protein|nr:hypothetical protein [Alphaproteobacteria bacterium]
MKKLVFCHGLGFTKSILLPLILSIESFYGRDKVQGSILKEHFHKSLTLSEISDKKESAKKEENSDFVFTDNLENSIEIINLDLGYFDEKNIPNEKYLDGAIAIGHGLGFNKLLDMNVKWSGIVGISTLLQFVYDEESKRKIENLQNTFNLDAELVLKSMVGRLSNNEAVMALPYPNMNVDLIKQDIEYLKNINSKKLLQQKQIPTLFLHGSKDNWCDITEAKNQLSDYNLIINENASHILGYLHALWCCKNIVDFIKNS